MASITKEKSGAYRLKYLDGEKTIGIRLGTRDKHAANSAKAFIEALITSKELGVSPNAETVAWLNRLDNTIHARIAKAGLTPPRQARKLPTLKELIDKFHETFAGKEQTAVFYGHTTRNLLDYFTDCPLEQITEQAADEFRVWLDTAQTLARATVARRIIACRTIWKKGQRWKMTADNPFSGVKAGNQANEARKRSIPATDALKLMDAAPDAQWRLIIALSRFGGVRVPSEVLPLKWGDINWEARTIRITSPKTEHHTGGGTRIVPLFDEIHQPLLDCFELAQPGDEFIITRYQGKSLNLRTHFERIILKAGLKIWPKPFHNMRRTRQDELSDALGPYHACKIMGNSLRVAEPHYLMDHDPEGRNKRALQIKTTGPKTGPVTAQNPAQTASAPKRTELTGPHETLEHQGFGHTQSPVDTYSHINKMGLNGFEPLTSSLSVTRSNQLSYKPEQPGGASPANSK